jgi:hypothetical protein
VDGSGFSMLEAGPLLFVGNFNGIRSRVDVDGAGSVIRGLGHE